MKTIYSLKEIYDEVLILAAQRGTDHVMINVKMQTNQGIIFSCYFHGCKKIYEGKTPSEAIANLRKEEFPESDKNQVDVEIEHESEPAC